MIRKQVVAGVFALAALLAPAARADGPLSMASSATGGTTYTIVLAIAKAASTYGGLDIRPRPFKATTQGISFVDSGEVNFGLESALGLTQAYNGSGVFDGTPFKNLRLVGAIYPFRVGLFVRKDSPLKSIADLKGHRLITNFKAAPNISTLTAGLLATAGLTTQDVQGPQVTGVAEGHQQFIDGTVDADLLGLDSVSLTEITQAVGDVRFLTMPSDADAAARAQQWVPTAQIVTIDEPGHVGVEGPTPFLQYDYFVYTSADAPDDEVVKLIDSMIKGKADMTNMVSAFSWYDTTRLVPQIDVPYHPAAEAHYKELGLWPAQ